MLIMTIKIDHFDSQASLTPIHSCPVFSFLLLYPKLFSTPLFSSPSPLLSPLQLFYVILSSPLLLSFLLSSSHLLLSFLPSFHHITSHHITSHHINTLFISFRLVSSHLWLASCCQHSVIMDAQGQSLGTRGRRPLTAEGNGRNRVGKVILSNDGVAK